MTIERCIARAVSKPWGSHDLAPWSPTSAQENTIGEIWFERKSPFAQSSALLLKLLFTKQPLSIQVHPDDDMARSMGFPHGKTEAWYILSADPGSQVAIGLKEPLSNDALRKSVEDGSIANRMHWHPAVSGDFHFLPAGTIHAIGAGIIIAEIQQRSDVTFRLFDYGRGREIHADQAIAAMHSAPVFAGPRRLDSNRQILVADAHFVLEKLELSSDARWDIRAKRECWILVLSGDCKVGGVGVSKGETIYLDAECADIEVGALGLVGLLTYPGPDVDEAILWQRHARGEEREKRRLTVNSPPRLINGGSGN